MTNQPAELSQPSAGPLHNRAVLVASELTPVFVPMSVVIPIGHDPFDAAASQTLTRRNGIAAATEWSARLQQSSNPTTHGRCNLSRRGTTSHYKDKVGSCLAIVRPKQRSLGHRPLHRIRRGFAITLTLAHTRKERMVLRDPIE
jgi:hypothetical protein